MAPRIHNKTSNQSIAPQLAHLILRSSEKNLSNDKLGRSMPSEKPMDSQANVTQ